MEKPQLIELIGNELCLIWKDGTETYFPAAFLRLHSPSAENKGEVDILGQRHGGLRGRVSFDNATLQSYEEVGNYAIRPIFGDGHRTGIYSWDYLRELAAKLTG